MISGRQLKNILGYTFSASASNNGMIIPTANFVSSILSYSPASFTPSSITFSGVITPNDGLSIAWRIRNDVGTQVAAGTNLAPAYTLTSPPSIIGTYVYTLEVDYKDSSSNLYTLSYTATFEVLEAGKVGGLSTPTDNIIVPIDLAPFESSLSAWTQTTLINTFDLDNLNNARIVIVVPNSFGTLVDIVDVNDISMLSQFNVVVDAPNARKIYVSINSLAANTYKFKLVY